MDIRLIIGNLENKDKLKIKVERELTNHPSGYEMLKEAIREGKIYYCETENGLEWVTKEEMMEHGYHSIVTLPDDII